MVAACWQGILRRLAVAALVAVPIVMYMGRARWAGCEPPVHGPCDPYEMQLEWPRLAVPMAIALGIILLVVAWFVTPRDE